MELNFKQRGISPEKRAKLMKRLVEGSFIDFKADGSYEISILGSKQEKLFWQMDESQMILSVKKNSGDAPNEIKILTLNKKELILVLPEPDNKVTKMYFEAEKEE